MAAGDWKDMLKGIQMGDFELVKYYLKEGVDPNYQHPEFLTTPLIESIENGHIEITKLLLDSGADPHLKVGLSDDTPWKVAKKMKCKDTIDLLEPFYRSKIKIYVLKILRITS